MNIILIGMRGSGKSNISRRLAVLTKRTVMSSDTMIEYENGGKTIAKIVSKSGGDWRAFRNMEYAVVKKICVLDGVIIDCGGGVVVDVDKSGQEVYSKRKVETLRKCGTVVWLKGDIKRLVEKVKNKDERPPLNKKISTEDLMRKREPFYARAADIVIDIEGKKRPELAELILSKLKNVL